VTLRRVAEALRRQGDSNKLAVLVVCLIGYVTVVFFIALWTIVERTLVPLKRKRRSRVANTNVPRVSDEGASEENAPTSPARA
jgi:hypothetical protein